MESNIRRVDRPALLESLSLTHSWPVVIIYVVFFLMLIVLSAVNPTFPSVFSVTNLLGNALPLVFASFGQTIVILVRGIDLSIGPAMSLVMVIAASLMKDSPSSIVLTIILCIAIGLAIGLLNGIMVVAARLQPIIVTLASSSILSGLALFIMPQPGGHIPEGLNVLSTGAISFLPVPGIILIASLLLVWLPMRRSRMGQAWYAVGGNEAGAYYSGVNVVKAKLSAFIAAGMFAAFGGLILSFQTLTGDAMIGEPFTINSIAAAVLGGTSLAGGRGGAVGAVGGVLVLTIAVDILFFLQVSAYYQYVFSGSIVILALAIIALSEYIRSHRLRAASLNVDTGGEKA